MHHLFLGLVQYHFRELIIINKQANKELKKGIRRPVDLKELEKVRQTLKSNPTMFAITCLHVVVLEALVQEHGVELSNRTHPRKKDMVEALLNELDPCDQAFIADGLIEECASQVKPHTAELSRSVEALMDKEMNDIQEMIGRVQRPSWHHGPPKNLGDTEHGKLKAEQWKSSIEFDLPMALMHLWGPGCHNAACDRTPLGNIQYTTHTRAYPEHIQEIFPHHLWHPNCHAALHIRKFLLRYGPMHGWWMFPFERIIGALQKMNTNYKIGELEKTMLETFCVAVNVKAMMQSPTGPVTLQEAAKILGQCCDLFTGDTSSHHDIHVLKTPIPNDLKKAWDIAETRLHQGHPYTRCNHLTLYKQLNVLGVPYCGYA
ncbi:hypothetical protein CY34DRAFT_26833 [Suillus luteus UH-Slu-Lm8-n1]|uniref:Uncharacterized protein n=1 Tax=Suillus luteus UH-Slu-Lm8-n1 TaxID=930992 RepID=A0A0D0A8T8_9AGAM|nr:hypothetical protein CY34DRAFT_26833 [Suillus luteus UH-Slu-Lm8-n1]